MKFALTSLSELSNGSLRLLLCLSILYDSLHLVHNNLDWWHRNGFHDSSAKAIVKKLIHNGYELNIGDQRNIFTLFIDYNCLPTLVVARGFGVDGVNAMRWMAETHQALYA